MQAGKAQLRGALANFVARRNVEAIGRLFFGVRVTPGQARIAACVAWGDHRRVAITAYTRYGKTWAVALGIAIGILFNDRDDSWAVVSPTSDQSAKVREYFAVFVRRCPQLRQMLPVRSGNDVDRINREVSKRRMTFEHPTAGFHQSLEFYSAEGEADRLMGEGARHVIEEESCLIADHVHRAKVKRMTGDDEEGGYFVKVFNPWHKNGHAYVAWCDPNYHTIHIDWRQGLEEGRHSQAFFDERRSEVTPMEWTILYESEFPDQAEDQLISTAWVQAAVERGAELMEAGLDAVPGVEVRSLDVASTGTDLNVLSELRVTPGGDESRAVLFKQRPWHQADTMQTAVRVHEAMPKNSSIAVDATGEGKGVADRLSDLGHKVKHLRLSEGPRNKDRFADLPSEIYWNMRIMFEEGRIDLVDCPEPLRAQLTSYRFEFRNGKIKVVKPGKNKTFQGKPLRGKSPDYGDSLAYGLYVKVVSKPPRRVKARPVLR